MIRIVFFFSVLAVLFISCKEKTGSDNITEHIQIRRFEKDLFESDPARINRLIDDLEEKYPQFLTIFSRRIIRIGPLSSPRYEEFLKEFITDYNNNRIYERTMEIFPDLTGLEKDLSSAFSIYKNHFPEKPVPRVVSYISGLNQSIVSDSSLLGIGLDKYLGVEEEFYTLSGIYKYMRINMHREKIPSDCMRLWAITEFGFNDSVNNLVSNMIYEGMVMYFVHQMLPSEPDTLIWGFTGEQMKFCRENEKQMWTYLIENKLLFKTDKFTIGKFIQEGPFTKDFSTASPARAAVWIGYNIVDSYVKKHNVSLHQLMNERDYIDILNKSGYNP